MITSLVLAALMVGASQQTGSISGVITDTTSRELAGATLITTSDDGAVRRTTTDLNGRIISPNYQRAAIESRSACPALRPRVRT